MLFRKDIHYTTRLRRARAIFLGDGLMNSHNLNRAGIHDLSPTRTHVCNLIFIQWIQTTRGRLCGTYRVSSPCAVEYRIGRL